MLRVDDYNKSLLVTVGYKFGKEYGGHLASMLVMFCLANRFKKGWGSWPEIIERIPKFAAEDVTIDLTGIPNQWDQNWIRLLHEVEGIYTGSSIDLAKNCTYWADSRRITSDWFKNEILHNDRHLRLVEMNTLWLFS